MNQLPDKPSELIRLALADLRKVEGDRRYEVEMGVWHFPEPNGPCRVCLAGSVMAKSLGVEPSVDADPYHFREGYKFDALDEFRMGELKEAFKCLRIPLPDDLPVKIPICDYEEDPERFHEEMQALANLLEEYDL